MGRKESKSNLACENKKLQEQVKELEEQVETLQSNIEHASYVNYLLVTALIAFVFGTVTFYAVNNQPKKSEDLAAVQENEDLAVSLENEEFLEAESYKDSTYENVTFYRYPISFEVILEDKGNLESISGWDLVEQEDVHVYLGQYGLDSINRNFEYYKVATWKDKTIYASSIDVTECQVTWAFKEGWDVYYDGYLLDDLYPEILADLFLCSIRVNEEKKVLSIYQGFKIN